MDEPTLFLGRDGAPALHIYKARDPTHGARGSAIDSTGRPALPRFGYGLIMVAPANARTIVLGVDSVDLLLMERWCAQGLLPFFNSMLESGTLVRLSTVSRILQGAVWPGLLSGRSPGQHGTYYLTQLTSGTYNLDPVDSNHADLNP